MGRYVGWLSGEMWRLLEEMWWLSEGLCQLNGYTRIVVPYLPTVLLCTLTCNALYSVQYSAFKVSVPRLEINTLFKGTVQRDFRPLVFSFSRTSLGF